MSPVTAAQTLLHSACKKRSVDILCCLSLSLIHCRKEMLQKTMNLLLQIIQTNGTTPSQKDGALHMIGTMADILLKKPIYKEQMEKFLVEIVFPEFNSPHGHLRARACWVLHTFIDVKYQNEKILAEACRYFAKFNIPDSCKYLSISSDCLFTFSLTTKSHLSRLRPQLFSR